MGISNLMVEGLQLMVLGMSVVFLFLGLLVITMHLTSRLVRALESRQENNTEFRASAPESGIDGALIAAISIAVQRYRHTHKH